MAHAPRAAADRIYRFNLEHRYQIEILGSQTLYDLAEILSQLTKHHLFEHLWHFTTVIGDAWGPNTQYVIPGPILDLGDGCTKISADQARIRDLPIEIGGGLCWVWDYGDNFEYDLLLEAVEDEPAGRARYPKSVKYKAAPRARASTAAAPPAQPAAAADDAGATVHATFGVWGGFGTVTACRFFTDVNELIWLAETEFAKGGDGGTEAKLCAHDDPDWRDDEVVWDDWPVVRAAKVAEFDFAHTFPFLTAWATSTHFVRWVVIDAGMARAGAGRLGSKAEKTVFEAPTRFVGNWHEAFKALDAFCATKVKLKTRRA
ncbi:hypothetical protein GGF32_009782 [Allomyces javanicus]|nr:hypothetical protein GGF32_009782 [Allomyces javanicus]